MTEHPTITALRATAPESPLPWRGLYDVFDANGFTVAWRVPEPDASHIAAAVNAAPHLLAEIDRLRAQVAAAREAVAGWPTPDHADWCQGWADSRSFAGCNCAVSKMTAARLALGLGVAE